MIDYQVRVVGADRLRRALEQEPTIAQQELIRAMQQAVIRTSDLVKQGTPVYRGRLRNAIGGSVKAVGGGLRMPGGELRGIVDASGIAYAPVMEFGRRPGTWPPIAPLIRWAHLVLHDASLAWAVRAAIYKRGIAGRFMFKRGLERARPYVKRIFEQALKRIVRRLTSG